MNPITLDSDEVILLKRERILCSSSSYSDDLILTNKNIYCISKGMFGKIKNIFRYPLDEIKIYNGEPQAKIEKAKSGYPALEIYLIDGTSAEFIFPTLTTKEIKNWINEICKVITGHPSTQSSSLNALPGTEMVAETIKGTIDTFKSAFGFSTEPEKQQSTKKCPSCSAKLIGYKGQIVHCQYCDTDTVL